jgi:hypothetical protein
MLKILMTTTSKKGQKLLEAQLNLFLSGGLVHLLGLGSFSLGVRHRFLSRFDADLNLLFLFGLEFSNLRASS